MGGGWSAPRPGRSTPGNDPVPIVQSAGWDPGPVWTGAENLATPPGFDPRTVQPVASRYTDWAIPAALSLEAYLRIKLLTLCRSIIYIHSNADRIQAVHGDFGRTGRPWSRRNYDPSKSQELLAIRCTVRSQKTWIVSNTTVKTKYFTTFYIFTRKFIL